MRDSRAPSKTSQIVGWLCITAAGAVLAVAARFFYMDIASATGASRELWGTVFGSFFVMTSLPLFFFGTALIKGWRGTTFWIVILALYLASLIRIVLAYQ